MVGQTLRHYRIMEQIGRGGMGVVYRAHDEHLSRDVAIKVLSEGALADKASRKRFRKEAEALSKLNHANIQTVYDFDTQDGVDFLVVELIPGTGLNEKLTAATLAEKDVARLGTQLAEGLAAAHEQGVLHRDLKPSNLRVMPDGRLKILDFGLAKLLRPVSDVAATETFTETQAVAGTLPYMAPEQLRGEPADARSEIYAAGAVLYEMATGQRPFRQQLAPRLTDAILHEAPPAPSSVNRQVSVGLESIILKCLDKEPERRYQSAKELRVDLERLSAGVAVIPAPTRPHRLRRLALESVLAALGLVLLVAGLGWRLGWLRPGPRAGQIQSLAVLPLENLSHDPEQEYFAEGMTDELITNLAKIGALRVISRTSVMHYKESKKTLPEIARDLKVDAVVEGSVERSPDRVRIRVQLIHAADDRHLWAESYERDVRDVLALQDEVSRAIANEIRIRLTPQEETRLATARPVNPQAHELYLKGRYYWNKRTPETLKKSLEYFQHAIDKDPSYALGYAGLADAYAMLGAGEYAVLPPKEAYPKAEAAAMKALELDSTLAEPHAALGYSKDFDWDWEGAEREFKQAIELNPGYATAHHWYALHLTGMGRHAEAIAEIRKADSLDPLSLIISADVAWVFWFARRYEQQGEQARKTLEMDPNFAIAHFYLSYSYSYKGMHKEAVAEMQKAVELSESSTIMAANLAYIYAVAGRRNEAIKILNELKARSKKEFVSADAFVFMYTGLGAKEQAFAWLEKAYEERSDGISLLKVAPVLDPLRSDPRYADLLRRVGLPP